MKASSGASEPSIWWFAFGYFGCYVPYSALTKALTDGRIAGVPKPTGLEILPVSTIASLLAMFAVLTGLRWWGFAGKREILGVRIPWPGRWTLLSGICTAAVIATTTLAYTFSGVSIVLMMLLMRGGVLAIAPIADAVARRKVAWYSWVALVLSGVAVVIPLAGSSGGVAITFWALIDVAVYLVSYFIRLRFMSRLAKSDDLDAKKRYFVEEQMVATPVVVTVLAAIALFGRGDTSVELARGFTSFVTSPGALVTVAIGVLSQGTGVFGGLILLDRRENTFCVPVNRASSILAGLLATVSLWLLFGAKTPKLLEVIGASVVVFAIVILSVPPLLAKRKAKAMYGSPAR